MLGIHPAIVIPQGSEYAKELCRHNAHHSQYGPPGRPYVFRDYPKRMYQAAHVPGKGTVVTGEQNVADEQEERNLLSRGFHVGKAAAFEAVRAQQTEFGRLAAEREWQIQHGRLSADAAAEVRTAEADHGARHLPEVPVTPIKKRGRPVKVQNPEAVDAV